MNYATYAKKELKDLSANELLCLKSCADEMKLIGEDHVFKWEDFNRYIFTKDIQENINGVLVYWIPREGGVFLSKIFVDPIDRRQGIASLMIDKLRELHRDEKITLGIAPSNKASIKLFESLGYELTVYYYEQKG